MPYENTPGSGEEARIELEKQLIDEYLKSKGHTRQSLQKLPAETAHKIMSEASTYVSCKLAEIENKARYKQNLQGTAGT